MKNTLIFFSLAFLLFNTGWATAQSFEQEQRQNPRVRTAFTEKENTVKAYFDSAHTAYPPKQIFLRIFKYERRVELWAQSANADTFKLVTHWDFCKSSGDLGPKRQQGDYQIPEGFYYIDRFNPLSNFYLSLGLNYPNAADRVLGKKGNLGGDIFIHGDCVTIGCIPITDAKIKELYLIAVKAKSLGQSRIPVHIFPYDFADIETDTSIRHLAQYASYKKFWDELKPGFLFFEKNHRLPQIQINRQTGHYFLRK